MVERSREEGGKVRRAVSGRERPVGGKANGKEGVEEQDAIQ